MHDNGTHSMRADCAHALHAVSEDGRCGQDESEALRKLVRDSLEVLTGRREADPFFGKEDATAIGTIGALMCVAAHTSRLATAVEAATLALHTASQDGHTRPRTAQRAPQ